ncbi:MAG: rhodanese-like domain-containing protein [Cytophagales bacterium]|nr:rhodanese-like domain-containing protein [Cytophagales bacterium]
MKKLVIILLTFTGFWAQAQQQKDTIVTGTNKKSSQIVKEIKSGKAYLVDVRTPEEFNAGHLKYAKNIDFKSTEFKTQIGKLKRKKTVYLYCRSGNRSGKAVDTLKVLGFQQPLNIGDFSALTAAGFVREL